jgi:hypothetical protein
MLPSKAIKRPGKRFEPPHILNRSRKRFFFSFSLGLLATPSSQESTLAIVTVCSSSGALTRIVNRVDGPSGISARALRRNAAIASTAASKRLSAGTRTECSMPSESVNETKGKDKANTWARDQTTMYGQSRQGETLHESNLLFAQDDNRVDAGGTARGNKAGHKGNDCQRGGDGGESRGIGPGDTIER